MSIIDTISSRIESVLFSRGTVSEKRPRFVLLGINILRVIYLSIQKSRKDEIQTKAHALTFITALSIVPLLAISFSIAKGFGMDMRLKTLLYEHMTGVRPEIIERILEYVRNTNVGTLGTLGLMIIIFTALKTVESMENAFNKIWGVTKQRSFFRKFSDYLSVIVICPLLVIAATGLTASLKSNTFVDMLLKTEYVGTLLHFVLSLGSHFTLWLAFSATYIFLPNVRIPIWHAFVGGICAGTMWNVVQDIYINFQVSVAKYNAIYGTFASLPMFLIWLYVSWLIILFGAEISWALGGEKDIQRLQTTDTLQPNVLENIAVKLTLLSGNRFRRGDKPLTIQETARYLNEDPLLIAHIVKGLNGSGILSKLAEKPHRYQPSRDLEKITIQDIVNAVHGVGKAVPLRANGNQKDIAVNVLEKARELKKGELSRITLQDLVLMDEKAHTGEA